MNNEYIIINKTAIQKRIEELEQIEQELIKNNHKFAVTRGKIDELISLLFQSTPLIPELQKTWNTAYTDALSIDEETYKPLFFKDYISNLKLDV